MMKKFVLLVVLIAVYSASFAQDSSFIPKQRRINGSRVEYTYYLTSFVPKIFRDAIDSINGGRVTFYERQDNIKKRTDIPSHLKREFRALTPEGDGWLMTYAHWEGKKHIHFIVFSMKHGKLSHVAAGMSDDDIDSIATIERLRAMHQIIFTNLKSKRNLHKF